MSDEISSYEDVIDLRDVIERMEELEEEIGDNPHPDDFVAERQELAALSALLEECKGYGGDEQWRGDWYPVTLIRDSYFQTYAQELAEDIGAIDREASWPNNYIDWERAADALRMDYTSVEFDGVTYWTR